MIRITPAQSSFPPTGLPPKFKVRVDSLRFYAVQVATDAFVFNDPGRRTQSNYFDSWNGDDRGYPAQRGTIRREVPGEHLEAPTGKAIYTLPAAVWKRFARANRLFYRMVAASDEKRRKFEVTTADVDWDKAPAVVVSPLPAQPSSTPASRFPGSGALARTDFLDLAKAQLGTDGTVNGRDGAFGFVVLDANKFDMTVLECHETGLSDSVKAMPRKPDAIMNGQFLSGAVGIDTEGQVIREGALINADSKKERYYVAQTWGARDVSGFHVGAGDPSSVEPNARAAFGGLGPMLLGGAPVATLTPWAQSLYDFGAGTGRGALCFDRKRGLILLVVQNDRHWFNTSNAMTMSVLRDRLKSMGIADAVFNDGSDSESLFAGGAWVVKPGYIKDEAMDFAISFVNRSKCRRASLLVIDGTKTGDGGTFARAIERSAITQYAPRNIAGELALLPSLASISHTIKDGVIETWKATMQAEANLVSDVIQKGGAGGSWADILYVSSHAWRHGQLWYYQNDVEHSTRLMIANPWSSSFRPIWRNTPKWLVIAGCAALSLHYARLLDITAAERAHLLDWQEDMHPGVPVAGLTAQKKVVHGVYHPGWAWFDRFFKNSGLRGVLGYWYRSPGGEAGDVKIIQSFSKMLQAGDTLLGAWSSANNPNFGAQAAWAAMVRAGCESDTLATLEDPSASSSKKPFQYYDRYQSGQSMTAAYREANRITDTKRIGDVDIHYNEDYGRFAVGGDADNLKSSPTPANYLEYQDRQGP